MYAIGIDAETTLTPFGGQAPGGIVIRQQRRPIPLPFPIPGRRTPPRIPPIPGAPPGTGPPRTPTMPPPDQPGNLGMGSGRDAVNVAALRDITDDSGGRTEIVRDPRDLDPTTAGLADELSKQVLPWVSKPWSSRWTLARDPGRSAWPIAARQGAPRVHRGILTPAAESDSGPGQIGTGL